MSAKNKVVEGDYKGMSVSGGMFGVMIMGRDPISIDKHMVSEYDVLDSEQKTSGVSAVSRAAVGAFFLGPAGLLAGVTAKKKGIHMIAIEFKDGKRSLLEVDDKLHKAIVKALF